MKLPGWVLHLIAYRAIQYERDIKGIHANAERIAREDKRLKEALNDGSTATGE